MDRGELLGGSSLRCHEHMGATANPNSARSLTDDDLRILVRILGDLKLQEMPA